MKVLSQKLLSLGRGEDGAALVTTLATFFFMYVTIAALYAFGASIREKIQLQDACDAAAYSAAVVQADTFSRIATLNRQMAWAYVQMTRRQLDYCVMKLLDRACAHFDSDYNEASDYSHATILACSNHKSLGGGWYIGADAKPTTVNQMRVNGIGGLLTLSIPVVGHMFNLGACESPSVLKGYINTTGVGNALDIAASGDSIGVLGQPPALLPFVAEVVSRFTWASADPLDALTLANDVETLASLAKITQGCSWDSAKLGGQVTVFLNQLKTQILSDRLSIATMNLAERWLARKMPERIDEAVRQTLRANLPEKLFAEMRYRVFQEEHPLATETLSVDDPTGLVQPGYFGNLHNNHNDEKRFLDWAGYGTADPVCRILSKTRTFDFLYANTAGGVDQWFVRGNGRQRTDGMIGLQRCYKHWAEHANDAAHNPFPPSCWNEEKLHQSPRTVALYCEWQWWADKWTCPYVWFLPPVRIHLPLMTWGLFNRNCNFTEGGGKSLLAVITAKIAWLAEIGSLFKYYIGALGGVKSNCSDDDNVIADSPQEAKPCPMKDYKDGCYVALEIPPNSARYPVPFTQYERIYGDDAHLYNEAYVGECAKPLVLRQSYFGPNGTISVGVARKTSNPWSVFMPDVSGLYSIFTPKVKWRWAFASAKAGFRDPDLESDEALRRYRIHWDASNGNRGSSNKKEWNLIQDDWDAVMVPVRQAKGMALGTGNVGTWAGGMLRSDFLADWIKGKWRDLNGTEHDAPAEWENVSPPAGMLAEKASALNWKELAGGMLH